MSRPSRHVLGSVRRYSQASSASLYLADKPCIARLPHRSVLEVTGPDARKFLNGQTCKNVEDLRGGYSGFLNASIIEQPILHTVFIFIKSSDSYLISHESPSTHPAPLQTLLPPFKLRSKVRIKDVSDQWDVYATFGDLPNHASSSQIPNRTWKFGSGGAAESQWSWYSGFRDLDLGDGEVGCWDLRAGAGMGMKQILVPKGQSPTLASRYREATLEDYNLYRTSLGLPEGPEEVVPGSALPLESCMDIHGGVDFRKGCYLGQELTVRTYHTGATRKRILPIRLFPLSSPSTILLSDLIDPHKPDLLGPPGDKAASSVDITFYPPESSATKRPKPAGKILNLHSAYPSVGLGLVRLEYAEKSWWSDSIVKSIEGGLNIGRWISGEADTGKLTASIGGEEWGVYVGKGKAYGDALEEMKKNAEAD